MLSIIELQSTQALVAKKNAKAIAERKIKLLDTQ
jgi:hypothetical protein